MDPTIYFDLYYRDSRSRTLSLWKNTGEYKFPAGKVKLGKFFPQKFQNSPEPQPKLLKGGLCRALYRGPVYEPWTKDIVYSLNLLDIPL